MEPERQVEIQLGHMCNNRCVFCVSGQRTGMGEARPLPTDPILASISEAYEAGHRKITLLGGEPTLQPAFMDVLRHCVALGFEDIVIFTNGVKTRRAAFVDEILATGGNFTWRISIQGATKEAHERTTQRERSFDRILESMGHLAARGERITVNMCVVSSNYASVDRFPELCARYGVAQLHLDMMRPLDAGDRTTEELHAMIPRYSDMAAPLTRMIEGFPRGFDVNIGNLPYCIAPRLAPFVHHDGERTSTIAIDGDDRLSKPWDKYFIKRRDKSHPDACRECVFRDRCSGVFDTYREAHGISELVPIRHRDLAEIDPGRHYLSLHVRPLARRLARLTPPAPFTRVTGEERGEGETQLTLHGPSPLSVALRRPDATAGAAAVSTAFTVHVLEAPADADLARAGLRALWALLAEDEDLGAVVRPLGEDAVGPLARSVAARLRRLHRAAPFGQLAWRETRVSASGDRAELSFVAPDGQGATLWLAEASGRAQGGYELADTGAAPGPALVEGLRALLEALRPQRAADPPPPAP